MVVPQITHRRPVPDPAQILAGGGKRAPLMRRSRIFRRRSSLSSEAPAIHHARLRRRRLNSGCPTPGVLKDCLSTGCAPRVEFAGVAVRWAARRKEGTTRERLLRLGKLPLAGGAHRPRSRSSHSSDSSLRVLKGTAWRTWPPPRKANEPAASRNRPHASLTSSARGKLANTSASNRAPRSTARRSPVSRLTSRGPASGGTSSQDSSPQ